jgi:hypothetical protein
MDQSHPFIVVVEVDPIFDNRFAWRIMEGEILCMMSEQSYATREDAQADADMAMSQLLQRLQQRDRDEP